MAGADSDVERREASAQERSEVRDDDVFRAEVVRIDEIEPHLLRPEKVVILEVCGHIGIAAGAERLLDLAAAGSAAEGAAPSAGAGAASSVLRRR